MTTKIHTTVISMLAGAFIATSSLAAAETGPPLAELYRSSYALEAKGDAAGSLAKMREVQAQTPNSYFVRARMAWLAYLAGQHQAAVQAYNDAIRLKPAALEPRLGLTLPLLAQGKWRDLDRACRDVLKKDPNNMTARARLAHALYSVGNYPDSATIYRKLIGEYPADLTFQTGLAWDLLKLGRREEARTLFQQVLAVSPDNASAKAGMAVN
ncbi:MAG: tetratricopeptide repeat protein [Polyangiaceae bacterium]|nr:tetratricopeptide repeat protein [Polyangiaceae bacterium]